MKTGVLGLGAMGYPIALNLHKAGLLQAVWNRSVVKAQKCATETGVEIADDPADLARRSEIIVTSVSADSDLLSVIEAMRPGLKPGSVVVDTSTVSSGTAIKAATILEAVDAAFLDAPVSGGVEGAKNAKLSVMLGGQPAALDRARPALEAISARIVHMGPVGSGQATKAVNQIMVAGIAQGVTEALAFGQAMGLDLDKVVDVVSRGAAGNWFLDHRGPTMIRDRYHVGFKLALHHKDLAICKSMAERFGAALAGIERTLADYEVLMAEGRGAEDISALFRLKKRLFESNSSDS